MKFKNFEKLFKRLGCLEILNFVREKFILCLDQNKAYYVILHSFQTYLF